MWGAGVALWSRLTPHAGGLGTNPACGHFPQSLATRALFLTTFLYSLIYGM